MKKKRGFYCLNGYNKKINSFLLEIFKRSVFHIVFLTCYKNKINMYLLCDALSFLNSFQIYLQLSKAEIFTRTNLEPLDEFIKRKRLRWLGYVLKMIDIRIPKRVEQWITQGRFKLGRPAGTKGSTIITEAHRNENDMVKLKE